MDTIHCQEALESPQTDSGRNQDFLSLLRSSVCQRRNRLKAFYFMFFTMSHGSCSDRIAFPSNSSPNICWEMRWFPGLVMLMPGHIADSQRARPL